MDERLRDNLDTFAAEHGYSGRSEVIREACQSLLAEYEETDYEGQRVLATVTAVFGYDKPEIERRMMDIRHEFEASIRSNSHNCLDGNAGCVETFVVEAPYDDVLRFIGNVRGADESVSVEYTVVPADVMNAEVSDLKSP
ncbi:nickel-responsive transcriptional regulator NikR [Haloferax sp. Atlit-12N]|uniref:CopG family ribbon-helix-helix protein n=1 Tax=Haloferax sp. Atlit-12N TaxID=2077203 RepID=UPI000E23CFCA|nr:nickel-responsive transcriptional regulator NikR [Haloferax sp. Atlit-12N]RDZ62454.1 nickel-responsive transcriptional regulator NikR [Haloferax sp. Atlit-12N]